MHRKALQVKSKNPNLRRENLLNQRIENLENEIMGINTYEYTIPGGFSGGAGESNLKREESPSPSHIRKSTSIELKFNMFSTEE